MTVNGGALQFNAGFKPKRGLVASLSKVLYLAELKLTKRMATHTCSVQCLTPTSPDSQFYTKQDAPYYILTLQMKWEKEGIPSTWGTILSVSFLVYRHLWAGCWLWSVLCNTSGIFWKWSVTSVVWWLLLVWWWQLRMFFKRRLPFSVRRLWGSNTWCAARRPSLTP